MRILLVEDHDDTREALAFAFRADGHIVFEACNGLEGLSRYTTLLAADIRPDLVISDSWMPGLRGLSLAACIRSVGGRCPFWLVTAHDLSDTRTQAHSLDVEVIPKPFDLGALRSKVGEMQPQH